jgi:hypothetical protein
MFNLFFNSTDERYLCGAHRVVLLLIFVLFITNGCSGSNESANNGGVVTDGQGGLTITRHDISWVLDSDYQYGRFANGDYYVIDPGTGVKVVDIIPGASTYNGFHINGSEKNPVSGTTTHGYDNQLGGYDETLNVGLNVSVNNPLVLNAKDSLVSSISNTPPATHDYGGQQTFMKTCAVLTVLASAVPDGTFRPSYTDRSHSKFYQISEMDYSLLKKLTPAAGAPSITDVETMIERLFLDHFRGWGAVYYHPLHMANYGREIASELGLVAVMLHTDLPDTEKATLLIRYVQIGIDLYGILINGGQSNWYGEAGHGQGRKWPILFTGLMLNDADMQSIGEKSGAYLYSGGYGPENPPPDYLNFGMDDETFYVTAQDVAITNSGSWNPDDRSGQAYPYTNAMIGMPEWGIRHNGYPEQSDSAWYAIYRQCCTALAWHGHILAALMMDAKDLWNHNALFDYMDRYTAIANGDPDPFGISVQGVEAGWRSNNAWVEAMWDMYRSDY